MAQDEKIASYVECFVRIKERKLLKEIMEREMLLEFIALNVESIDEFPLLESEQKGMISLLTHRSADLPLYGQIAKWINEFLVSLNLFSKAMAHKDTAAQEEQRANISNIEAILLHIVQGVVYALGLIKDNMSHCMIRTFGVGALEKINDLTESVVYDVTYWKALVDTFFHTRIEESYNKILEDQSYEMRREGNLLIVGFCLDTLLLSLEGTTQEIKNTRIQDAFEPAGAPDDKSTLAQFVLQLLKSDDSLEGLDQFSAPELQTIARLASIDPLVKKCMLVETGKEHAATAEKDEKSIALENRQKKFIKNQVLALSIGAALAIKKVKQDLLMALKDFSSQEKQQVGEIMGSFTKQSMAQGIELLLERGFLLLLRVRGEEHSGKITVRMQRTRRTSQIEVKKLYENGMNRIRQRKFFDDDLSNPHFQIFKARTPQELKKTWEVLNIETPLRKNLARLWQDGSFRVEFQLILQLAVISKVTTNSSQKIAEILTSYGLKPKIG